MDTDELHDITSEQLDTDGEQPEAVSEGEEEKISASEASARAYIRQPWSGKISMAASIECGACQRVVYYGANSITVALKRDGWVHSSKWGWLCPEHGFLRGKREPKGSA